MSSGIPDARGFQPHIIHHHQGPPPRLNHPTDQTSQIIYTDTNPAQIDFDKLAAELGLTNPRSASNAWSRIKAKLWGDAPNTPLTAAKPKKRAAGGDDDAAAADAAAADGNDTPAKKPKATPKPRGPRKKNVKSAPVAPKPEDEEEKSEVAKVEDAFMGEA